jgi:hypothetical protein
VKYPIKNCTLVCSEKSNVSMLFIKEAGGAMKRLLSVLILCLCTTLVFSQNDISSKKTSIDIKAFMPITLNPLGFGGEVSIYSVTSWRTTIGFSFIHNSYVWPDSRGEEFYGMPLMYGDLAYCFTDHNTQKAFFGIGFASQTINMWGFGLSCGLDS